MVHDSLVLKFLPCHGCKLQRRLSVRGIPLKWSSYTYHAVKYFHSSQRALNHYQTLGVRKTAPLKEIKAAYIKLCKIYHPDKNKFTSGKFLDINEAYETLKDPSTRHKYDVSLGTAIPHSENIKVRGPRMKYARTPPTTASDRSSMYHNWPNWTKDKVGGDADDFPPLTAYEAYGPVAKVVLIVLLTLFITKEVRRYDQRQLDEKRAKIYARPANFNNGRHHLQTEFKSNEDQKIALELAKLKKTPAVVHKPGEFELLYLNVKKRKAKKF
ncbi:uncharacterized protein LOC106155175 isoform X1 [Lingula anatina]|uniref:Uncharacterized protein LOC106155175 isoform X1 n=1 Tax=Lingula anatina TaxID=7574 RepID=A0A1S3HIP6_LINAN|nr:uncharacterized protein LOC106155175 isoform X1 [Lingula anatina]|eukprot:XP_013385326.1 uncharacterized protein LOC106155175 isoform X1 [Lingula anatina]